MKQNDTQMQMVFSFCDMIFFNYITKYKIILIFINTEWSMVCFNNTTPQAGQWWNVPLLPALRSEFQDPWGYTEKSCFKKPKPNQTQKSKNQNNSTDKKNNNTTLEQRLCYNWQEGL